MSVWNCFCYDSWDCGKLLGAFSSHPPLSLSLPSIVFYSLQIFSLSFINVFQSFILFFLNLLVCQIYHFQASNLSYLFVFVFSPLLHHRFCLFGCFCLFLLLLLLVDKNLDNFVFICSFSHNFQRSFRIVFTKNLKQTSREL